MDKYKGEMRFTDYFSFLNRQNPSRIFRRCDEKRIQELVRQFGRLPAAYLEFMRYAGNGSFWVGSDCSFDDLPVLRGYADELLEENAFSKRLPDDAFVFWMHQGYMFCFFCLSDGDDPPVYYYSEGAVLSDFVKCSGSFTEYIMKEDGCYRHPSEIR